MATGIFNRFKYLSILVHYRTPLVRRFVSKYGYVHALQYCHDGGAETRLLRIASDPRHEQRMQALEGLVIGWSKKAIPIIRPFLQSSSSKEREQAAEWLKRLGYEDEYVREISRSVIARGQERTATARSKKMQEYYEKIGWGGGDRISKFKLDKLQTSIQGLATYAMGPEDWDVLLSQIGMVREWQDDSLSKLAAKELIKAAARLEDNQISEFCSHCVNHAPSGSGHYVANIIAQGLGERARGWLDAHADPSEPWAGGIAGYASNILRHPAKGAVMKRFWTESTDIWQREFINWLIGEYGMPGR